MPNEFSNDEKPEPFFFTKINNKFYSEFLGITGYKRESLKLIKDLRTTRNDLAFRKAILDENVN